MVYQQHKIPWRLWYISHNISEFLFAGVSILTASGWQKISPCFVLRLTWKISHSFFSSQCLRYLGVYLFTHSETCSLFWMLFCCTSALITDIIPLLYTFYELSFILQKWPVLYLVHYLWGGNAFIFHCWAHIGLGIPLKLFRWFSCLIMILLCLSPLPVCLKCAVKFLWTATEALNH